MPALELKHIILILIGIALAYWLQRQWRNRKAAPAPEAGVASTAEQQAGETRAVGHAAPAFGESESSALASRLHQLEAAFSPFSNSSAHPRELGDNAEFRQAAALLAEPAVPLEIVLQYAHGANWGLSCAAFAALRQRPDRDEALDQVVVQFDRVAPWAMYFALEYFLRCDPRPPVGAAVAGAKEWWRDNPILPLLVQD